MIILRQYEDGDFIVTEYTKDGTSISYVQKMHKHSNMIEAEESEPKDSVEEIAEETLLETKYQTFLLEMMI